VKPARIAHGAPAGDDPSLMDELRARHPLDRVRPAAEPTSARPSPTIPFRHRRSGPGVEPDPSDGRADLTESTPRPGHAGAGDAGAGARPSRTERRLLHDRPETEPAGRIRCLRRGRASASGLG
jgi:hypothetical protein